MSDFNYKPIIKGKYINGLKEYAKKHKDQYTNNYCSFHGCTNLLTHAQFKYSLLKFGRLLCMAHQKRVLTTDDRSVKYSKGGDK